MEEKSKNTDYRVMLDMISDLEEQTEYYSAMIRDQLISEEYDEKIITFISLKYPDKKDELMNDDELLKKISDKFYTGNDEYNESVFKSIIRSIYELIAIKEESNTLRTDADKVINDYVNYLTSPEYQEKKKQRIIDLKNKAEAETNEVEKEKVMKLVRAMESTMTLSFLFTRLEKLGKDEKDNIINAFFNDKRSSYIINRYKVNAKKVGFNPEVYKYFFNLEEKFLEEDYHVYNNLFLFFNMRYIAYIDVYNKEERMYAQSLFNNMANLIYHKFPSDDDENNFKNVIYNFLDYFKDDYKYFEDNNFTHPKHPRRIEKDKEHNKEIHDMLVFNINKLSDDLNIEKIDIADKSNDELREIYEKLNKDKEEQDLKLDDEVVETDESIVESEYAEVNETETIDETPVETSENTDEKEESTDDVDEKIKNKIINELVERSRQENS